MTLPLCLDPLAVTAAASIVRAAIDASHLAVLPEDEKQAVVASGVAKMIAAGVYVDRGRLHLPRAGPHPFN